MGIRKVSVQNSADWQGEATAVALARGGGIPVAQALHTVYFEAPLMYEYMCRGTIQTLIYVLKYI
jgi:hypothetical protein